MSTTKDTKDTTTTTAPVEEVPEGHARDVGLEGDASAVQNVPEPVEDKDPLGGEGTAIAATMSDLSSTGGEDHAEIKVPPNARISSRKVLGYDEGYEQAKKIVEQAAEQAKAAKKAT